MSNLTQMNIQPKVVQGAFKRNRIAALIGKVRTWNMRRQAIRELQAMPDSLLRDLGIERFQIAEVVNNSGHFARIEPVKPVQAEIAPDQKAAA